MYGKTIRYLTPLLTAVVLFLSGCGGRAPDALDMEINGEAAMIAEARSGRVLFAKAPDERFPPASTTKVMTAIVAVENMSLDDDIKVVPAATRVEPTIAGLKSGDIYTLRELLSAILVKSANDAAVAIAEAVAGSEREFTLLMNAKASSIGMENTFFATASGLPTGPHDDQYTTARDLVTMMRYALRYDVIIEMMSLSETRITDNEGQVISLKTHNRTLLWNEDAPWGKTGYTREAKRTFVGIDPSKRPKITFSLLRSDDLWKDIITLKDAGVEIYDETHRSFASVLAEWVKEQRRAGRAAAVSR